MGSEILILIGTLGGAAIGAILAPFFNHKYKIKQLKEEHKYKIKYLKEEIFYNRKLEYFEKLLRELQERYSIISNIKFYLKEKKIEKVIEGFKKLSKKDLLNWEGKSIFFSSEEIIEYISNFIKVNGIILRKMGEALEDKKINNKKVDEIEPSLIDLLKNILKLERKLKQDLK